VPPTIATTMNPIATTTSSASSFGVSGFGWRRFGARVGGFGFGLALDWAGASGSSVEGVSALIGRSALTGPNATPPFA
jgi:hypothetical protein